MEKVAGTIFVRFDFEMQIVLPEGMEFKNDDDDSDELTEECKDRAVEAALGALDQQGNIYIDGPDKPPAQFYIDISDSDVEEVRGEED